MLLFAQNNDVFKYAFYKKHLEGFYAEFLQKKENMHPFTKCHLPHKRSVFSFFSSSNQLKRNVRI